MRALLITLALLGLNSCKTTTNLAPGDFLSLETSAALRQACDTRLTGEEADEAAAMRSRLCRCLAAQPESRLAPGRAAALCAPGGDLDLWTAHITQTTQNQWPQDFLAQYPQNAPACLQSLTLRQVELFLFKLSQACEQPTAEPLEPLLAYPKSENQSCWLYTGLTAEGCVEATPCSGAAELRDLPLATPADRRVEGSVVLCQDGIQRAQRYKDPDQRNLTFSRAFIIDLALGGAFERTTYAPSNCHGTAQSVVGGFLEDLPVKTHDFARLADHQRCDAAARTALTSVVDATARTLALNPGGIVVNMRHDACKPTDCGVTKLMVDHCPDGSVENLQAYVFIEGMCVACWGAKLEAAGYTRLPETANWRELVPGCVLTQNDHSMVYLGQSHGYCSYYEVTTPFGPSQLRTMPCPRMWATFPQRWCPAPQAALRFELREGTR